MIKKQIYINKEDMSSLSFDILLTTNINDIGIKEPYVYPEWVPNNEYLKGDKDEYGDGLNGDIVIYDNKIYKCITSHSSTDIFILDAKIKVWEEMDEIESYDYDEWVKNKGYLNGDIVIHGDKTYKCITSHLSADIFSVDNDIWVKIVDYPKWKQEENYSEGDIITHDNKIYKCKDNHLSGDDFEIDKWEEIGVMGIATNTVEYIGESRIDEFKRYGKTINDSDLYNTKNPINEGGIIKEIIETKPKIDPFSKQDVYKYTFTDSNNNLTTYDDTGDGSSIISYTAKGLNEDNAINLPSFKNEELLGVIGKPKVEVDVFIDRGINNSFDKHIKISEIKTLEALEKYGNGFFKIKE